MAGTGGNLDRELGALSAEQSTQRAQLERLNEAVVSVRAMEPTIRALSDTVQAMRSTHESLAGSCARLTVSIEAVQNEMRLMREDHKELAGAKADLAARISTVELKQASTLSRAIPVVFAGLGSLAALAAAGAAWLGG
jgi:chromosome segregation ATPase